MQDLFQQLRLAVMPATALYSSSSKASQLWQCQQCIRMQASTTVFPQAAMQRFAAVARMTAAALCMACKAAGHVLLVL
jgi:uncharacterized membrane protein